MSARRPPSRSLQSVAYHTEGHRVGGVGGEGFAVLSYHLVGVAVVGGNQQNAVHLLDGGGYLADAGVHSLHGGLPRRSNTPVWPTMSQLAKFRIITSYSPEWMRFNTSSVT